MLKNNTLPIFGKYVYNKVYLALFMGPVKDSFFMDSIIRQGTFHMKSRMIDNVKVNENHQKGFSAKKQRPGDMEKGQGGKMGKGDKANWKRPNTAGTPRQA